MKTNQLELLDSTLDIFKQEKSITIPLLSKYQIDFSPVKSKRVKVLSNLFKKFLQGVIVLEAGAIAYTAYHNGINGSDFFDLATFTIESTVLGTTLLLNHKLPKDERWYQNQFYLDDTLFNITFSFWKRYTFKFSEVKNIEIKTNTFNTNYLYVFLKNGDIKKIRWYQTFLEKKTQDIINAFLEEVKQRIESC